MFRLVIIDTDGTMLHDSQHWTIGRALRYWSETFDQYGNELCAYPGIHRIEIFGWTVKELV